MKRNLLFASFCLVCSFASAQITLNEVLVSNAITISDPDYQAFSDWVELHNAGSVAVDLSGWFLSDDNDIPDKWAFPAGTSIAPGSFLLIWTDGENTGLHTGFKLSADGEKIFLSEASGTEIDRLEFGPQSTDIPSGAAPTGPATGATSSTLPPARATTPALFTVVLC